MGRIRRRGVKNFIAVSMGWVFLVTTGCATDPQQSQQQAIGALSGAVMGAAVGALTGKDAKSAIIGAVAGGALGFAAVTLTQYYSNQVRTPQQDQKLYGLTPVSTTPLVKVRSGQCAPGQVKKRESLEFAADYSLTVPESMNTVVVEERWSVKKADGQLLKEIIQEQKERQPGGYQVGGKVQVPDAVQPGIYMIEFKVRTGTSYDVASFQFEVVG